MDGIFLPDYEDENFNAERKAALGVKKRCTRGGGKVCFGRESSPLPPPPWGGGDKEGVRAKEGEGESV